MRSVLVATAILSCCAAWLQVLEGMQEGIKGEVEQLHQKLSKVSRAGTAAAT